MNDFSANSAQNAPVSPRKLSQDAVVLDYGLQAQVRLAPYALGFFGIGLPIFLWTARISLPHGLLAIYMLLFIVNWTVFMVMKAQVEARQVREDETRADAHAAHPARRQDQTEDQINARLWRQSLAAGLWTATLFLICLTTSASVPHAEMLLMICAGAAVGIIFFSAPVLLNLLTFGPLAAAGPILALHMFSQSHDLGRIMTGGLALALAMGLVLNRHLQQHYMLQNHQLDLMLEREAALAASDALHLDRVSLMETLSSEVHSGLKGIEHNLLQGLTHLTRAPAPRQYVDAALTEVSHLQSILVTTLDNDTAASGAIELDTQPLDIALLAQRLMAQFEGLAHSKGLDFSLNAQDLPSHGAAMGDEHRVEQVLAHLLSNALLYTQKGRVELKLNTLADDFLRVEVVDSGPGLSAEELAQAFVPHVRLLRTSSGHSGAGLGLSLSRSLATLMGGRLSAESTLDVGSKFCLDLPFNAKAKAPSRPVEAIEPSDTTEPGLRILLIANDSLRAASLRDSLENMGHKCLTTTSRERAITLARKAPIDACLISTGAFENLDDTANHNRMYQFLSDLRHTQAEARLAVLALLPDGDQAVELQALGVKPLLLPQNRESLARALAQITP